MSDSLRALAIVFVCLLAAGCDSPHDPGSAWMDGTEDVDGDGWMAFQDCDDEAAGANPGMLEVCGDSLDNDCDGTMGDCGLESVIDLSRATSRLVGEKSGSHAGWSISGVGDVNGDGLDDVAIGTWQDDEGGEYAGAVYLFFGPVEGSINLNRADAKLIGESPFDHAGWSVAGAGDINRDGFDDILIGGYGAQGGAGAAWIVHGPVLGKRSLSAAQARLHGANPYDYVGISVAGVGDLNGDGYADIALGAYGVDTPQYEDVGAVYVFHGPLMGNRSTASADGTLLGANPADWFGYSISGVADATGDGRPDLLIGAPGVTRDGPDAGAAYLYRGAVSSTMTAAGAHATFRGTSANDRAGASVSSGDLDGDGYSDLVIGAWGSDAAFVDAGAAYVIYGPVQGGHELAESDSLLGGAHAGDSAGFAVAVAPDINGDGKDDVIVGAVQNDSGGPDSGAAYAIYGPVSGKVSLADADVTFVGEVWDDRAGGSVAGGGDMDGDGYGDILIGAHGNDSGGTDSGAGYVVLGRGF